MTHEHQPEQTPDTCASAALHELADADLTAAERAATLEHGLRAVAELTGQRDHAEEARDDLAAELEEQRLISAGYRYERDEARAWARSDLNHLWPTPRGEPPAWLTEEPPDMPPRPSAEQPPR